MSRHTERMLDIEQTILGAGLLGKSELASRIATDLEPEMFYNPRHRAIFKAIQYLVSMGITPEILTIKDRLSETGSALDIKFIMDLIHSAIPPQNLDYLLNEFAKGAELAGVIARAEGVISEFRAMDHSDKKPEDILNDYYRESMAGIIKYNKIKVEEMSEILSRVEDMAKLVASGKVKIGLKTGFPMLDSLILGFQNGNLILVAGRPSTGKSSLMVNMIENITIKNDNPTLLISLEMPSTSIAHRILSAKMDMSSYRIRKGQLTDDEWVKYSMSAGFIANKPLFIADAPVANLAQILTICRQAHRQHGIKIIFIDYLQLIRLKGRSRNEEVGEASASLKGLARELDIPVVVLSQLSRGSEGRMPRLSDLRDSGSLEADADHVIMVHREWDEKKGEFNKEGQLLVLKARNESTGNVEIIFNPERTTFREKEINHGKRQEERQDCSPDTAVCAETDTDTGSIF